MAVVHSISNSSRPLAAARFHISLNVDSLERSVEFYGLLFDVPPAKLASDYAKFELADPPLVLSLQPNRSPRGGKLNHLGFRLTSGEELVAIEQRLESRGWATERQQGVECCHARQTKFWLEDPDGNMWEIYTLDDDADECRPVSSRGPDPVAIEPAAAIWVHRLGEPFGPKLLIDSDGVDQVMLQGTFNARLTASERQAMLREVTRVLRPAGRIELYQLTARPPLESLKSKLPGPAFLVESIPSAAQLIEDLQAAGFVDLHFEKLGDAPCFMADGVECRETRLVGRKPSARTDLPGYEVLYKGPFREAKDDRGNVFLRGQWTKVNAETREALQSGPLREQFVF